MTRLIALVLCLLPCSVFAQCESLYEDSTNQREWDVRYSHSYVLCFDGQTLNAILDDVIKWIDYAFQVGQTKYDVSTPIYAHPCRDKECQNVELELTIFIHPVDVGGRMNWCSRTNSGRCTDKDFNPDSRFDSQAEIHLDFVSGSRPRYGHYGVSIEEDLYRQLVHEVIHFIQVGVVGGRWPRWLPRWVIEGLASYEGWNSTPLGQSVFRQNLAKWVDGDEIILGRDMESDEDVIHILEDYHAGAMLSIVLQNLLGDDTHKRLFEQPLRDILDDAEFGEREVFEKVVTWWNWKRGTLDER